MYSKSLGEVNRNYIANMCPEIFEKIVAPLPYNPNLANLSMTSKQLQLLVLEMPCGAYLSDLKDMQPSYLRSFFAKEYALRAFCVGGTYLGMGIGAYINYDSILSAYAGAVAGAVVGGSISSFIGGYIIKGFEGAKNGVYGYLGIINPIPLAKLILKAEIACIYNVTSLGIQQGMALSKEIIVEDVKEMLEKHDKISLKALSFFKEANREFTYNLRNNISETQNQLSHPITRNGI